MSYRAKRIKYSLVWKEHQEFSKMPLFTYGIPLNKKMSTWNHLQERTENKRKI